MPKKRSQKIHFGISLTSVQIQPIFQIQIINLLLLMDQYCYLESRILLFSQVLDLLNFKLNKIYQSYVTKMEKEVKITEIKAKFTKDFETFGKMDPFLIFSVGKCQGKTETAQDAGKQPEWKQTITLTYLDEKLITVKAYEQDMTSNQFMGHGSIEVNSLKLNGSLQIKISSEEGQQVGTVFCKYALKSLQPSPMLIVKNIKTQFYRQAKFLLKTKPYFCASSGQSNMVTQVKEDHDSRAFAWHETLRIKIKDKQPITFNVLDKNQNERKLFGYESTTSQFKTTSGKKKFYVHDSSYQPLGSLQFDYQTLNLVNREQSNKNEEKIKEQQNSITKISISKVKGQINQSGVDIFFKVICGQHMTKTEVLKNSEKQFSQQWNMDFLAENRQNKITISIWDQNTIMKNQIYGVGFIYLPATSGEKKITLNNKEGNQIGSVTVNLSCEKVSCKSLNITEIKVKMNKSGDILGSSDPYVIAKIGGWSCRTETGSGQEYTFKRNLELKFQKQNQITFEIWDQDVVTNEMMFSSSYKISDLKEKKGDIYIPLKQKNGDNGGSISMKYTTKNVKHQTIQQKSSTDRKKQGSQSNINNQTTIDKKVSQKKIQQNKIHNHVNSEGKEKQKQQQKHSDKNKSIDRNRSIQQSSLEKSKHSFRLPELEYRNYGDKIFDKQSAATLQKSIHVYSMPKQSRFSNGPKYQGQPSYYVDTCFKPNSGRGTGFGFGNKRQFPEWMERNMKENPAPGAYFEDRGNSESYRPKGPTFGVSYKAYQKVTIPKEKKMLTSNTRLKPLGN